MLPSVQRSANNREQWFNIRLNLQHTIHGHKWKSSFIWCVFQYHTDNSMVFFIKTQVQLDSVYGGGGNIQIIYLNQHSIATMKKGESLQALH